MAVTLSGIGGSTGTLSAAGVGSGLDVKSLVSQLMAVEQQPLALLTKQEAGYTAKLSGLGSVSGALSSLQTAAKALVSASTDAYSAASSDNSVLTASAASAAVAGSYSVAVTALAQPQKLISAGVAASTNPIGSGAATTLSFQSGTITGGTLSNGIYTGATFAADPQKAAVTVTIDASNNTLAGIRDAINAANTGFTASIINDGSGTPYRLSLVSNQTGAASSLRLSVSGDAAIGSLLGYDPQTATQNLTQTLAARNAQLSVDGVAISSTGNTVSEAIQGVTLTLVKASPNPNPATATVTIQRDTGALTGALSALVSAYNGVNKALSGATAKGAALQGDWALLGIERQMRSILGGAEPTGKIFTMLSQLGVSFQKDGSLAQDSTKVSAALSANYDAAAALTAALGGTLGSAVTDMIGPTGPISGESDGLNRSIKDIGKQRDALQVKLDAIQARYQAQFSALDTLLSSMNSTSSFLTQQLGNLPNYYNNK